MPYRQRCDIQNLRPYLLALYHDIDVVLPSPNRKPNKGFEGKSVAVLDVKAIAVNMFVSFGNRSLWLLLLFQTLNTSGCFGSRGGS